MHQRAERRAHRQRRHRRGTSAPSLGGRRPPPAPSRRASSSSLPGDLGLAGDGGGGDGRRRRLSAGVRRAPPGGVDLAVEPAHVEAAPVGAAGRRRGSRRVRPARATGPPARATPANGVDRLVVARQRHRLRHHGALAGVAAEQQPVQRRGDGVLGRRPPASRPATWRGSSRRRAAAATPRASSSAQRRRGRPSRRRRRRRRGSAARRRRGSAAARARRRTGRRERQVDDGVLQALARVDRHQLHRGRVGVEPAGALDAAVRARPRPPGRRSQAASETEPCRSVSATSWSASPMWRRSVSRRSPSTSASTRAGSPSTVAASRTAATPRVAEQLDPVAQRLGDLVGEVVAAARRAAPRCGRRSR